MVAPSLGKQKCKGCGEWPGIHRRDWCVDCERKKKQKPLLTCKWLVGPDEICGKQFQGVGKASRCLEHKHLMIKQNKFYVRRAEKKPDKPPREKTVAVSVRLSPKLIERITAEVNFQNTGLTEKSSLLHKNTFIRYAVERMLSELEDKRKTDDDSA